MKKKKLKLKKQAYYFLAGIVLIIVVAILEINFYHDSMYKKTYEYQLTSKGYSLDEAKKIQDKLKDEEIAKLLEMDKDPLILSLLDEKYFLFKNLSSYLEYIEDEDEEDLKDVVAIVNVHANSKWYEQSYQTDTSLNEKMLVNKFYSLSEDYVPENQKVISLSQSYGDEGSNVLIDYAYEQFMDLWQAAKDAGFYLMVNSSYRNYEEQADIYDSMKKTQGERYADSVAARPGHSEHQTGLVVDMTSTSVPSGTEFKDSLDYQWLKDHAHLYGFIERYPEGKTYLTGYSPESWHWRYVGVEAATICHNEDITYDEYYAYYIDR